MTSINLKDFKSGMQWNKDKTIIKIENSFPIPQCLKNNKCIYEQAMLEYICNKCIEYKTAKKIIEMVKEIK